MSHELALKRRGVDAEEFAELLSRTTPLVQAQERIIEMHSAISDLFPSKGLARGSTVSIGGAVRTAGSMALATAMIAQPTQLGHWCVVVGMPEFGVAGAKDLGVDLSHLALIPHIAEDPEVWGSVLSAVLDTCDLVITRFPSGRSSARYERVLRRLIARARQRDAVLIVHGAEPVGDLHFRCHSAQWLGLGEGHGYLQARKLKVDVSGKGVASRLRTYQMWLPDDQGQARVEPLIAAVSAPIQHLRAVE